MKKIILLLIGLTVISCGGGDDDNNLSVGIDPIIGTWKASVDQSADFAALGYTDSVIFKVILTFNSNGTGSQTTEIETDNSQILALFEEELEDGNSTYTWVNVNGNPDFSNTRQFYSITEDGDDEEPDVSEVNFTSSFTELTIAESDEGFVFIKQ
ncbi:hypothetical protein OAQ15_01070 [Flavobacteriaceae bacterium]|nr:hypothetical protein [Flavobacteriaceae bacterium]